MRSMLTCGCAYDGPFLLTRCSTHYGRDGSGEQIIREGLEKKARELELQNRQLQEKADAWRQSYEELARKAKAVMDDLEKHGPGIVPHLIDTDDNDGEFLRREIRFALGPDEETKTEKRIDEAPPMKICGQKNPALRGGLSCVKGEGHQGNHEDCCHCWWR